MSNDSPWFFTTLMGECSVRAMRSSEDDVIWICRADLVKGAGQLGALADVSMYNLARHLGMAVEHISRKANEIPIPVKFDGKFIGSRMHMIRHDACATILRLMHVDDADVLAERLGVVPSLEEAGTLTELSILANRVKGIEKRLDDVWSYFNSLKRQFWTLSSRLDALEQQGITLTRDPDGNFDLVAFKKYLGRGYAMLKRLEEERGLN